MDRLSLAPLFKALGHPSRLQIAWRLHESPCAVAVLERDLDLRQPGLSQHLTALRESGVAVADREGKQVIYHLTPVASDLLQRLASDVSAMRPPARLRRAPECGVFAVAGAQAEGELT